jgi:hypothetical protein
MRTGLIERPCQLANSGGNEFWPGEASHRQS